MADKGIPPIPNERGRGERRGRGTRRPFGRGRGTHTIQTVDVCIWRGRCRGRARGPSTIITSTPYLRLRQRRAGLGRAIGLGLGQTDDAGHSNLPIEAPGFHPAEDVSCLPIMEPDCREMCPSQNVHNVDEMADRGIPPIPKGRGRCKPFRRGSATRTIQTADVPWMCIAVGRGRGIAGPSANIVDSPYLRLRQAMGLGSGPTVDADDKPIKKEDSGKSPTQENSSSTDKQECLNPRRSEDTTKEPSPATCDSTERNANAGHSNLPIEAPGFHPAEDVSCLPIMEPDCREMCPSQNVHNVDEMADRGIPPIPKGRGRCKPFRRGSATRTIQTADVPWMCIAVGRGRGIAGPSANIVDSPYLRLRQAMGLGSGPTVDADDKPIKKEDSGKSPTQENSSSTDKQECLNRSRSEDTTKEPSPATCDSTERNANAGHSNLPIEAPGFHPAEDVSCLPIMEPDCREMCPSQNVHNVDEVPSPLDDAKAILDFCFGELIATPDVFEDVMLLFQNNFIEFVLSDILLLEVIEDLYMKAEAYPAFTYNAMRMLICMINLERDAHNSTSVRDILLNFAMDQLQATLAFALEDQNVNMMASLLFAAEMYIQLEVGGLRLSRVGEAIVQILYGYMCVENIPARERYLNTVKILKLIGSSLEVDVPESLQEAINMLLSEISQESGLDQSTIETVNNFLNTVLSMTVETATGGNARSILSVAAQTEQDRSCPPQVAECPPQVAECPPQVAENHPVLYGPDGAALSAEKEVFLQNVMSDVDSPWSSPRSSD